MEIRKVNLRDVDQLQKIGNRTFIQSYASDMGEEHIKEYLKNAFSIEKLKAELIDKNSEFYFAELEGNVIGYLKINFGQSQTEINGKKSLEIERIYVLNEFHGKKVGQVFFEKVIEISKRKNAIYVWLGVWEKNPRAIRFYEKNGFVEFDKHIYKMGGTEPVDIMMKLKIIY